MDGEFETYLAGVEHRAKHAADQMHPYESVRRSWESASQADVPRLVEMLKLARRHLVIHDCVGLDELNRLARAAMEEKSSIPIKK